MQKNLESVIKRGKRMYTKFMNYNNSKKRFILYLFILTVCLLLLPIIKVSDIKGISWMEEETYALLFSKKYLISKVVILISLFFLLWWNISVKFKKKIIDVFSLREDEPLVDFSLLWVITSVFMGIVDTIEIATEVSGRISLTKWAVISQLLLLWGLVRAFISIWKAYKKTSKQTKILNIVSDEPQEKYHEEKKNGQLQHLFEDLKQEEE